MKFNKSSNSSINSYKNQPIEHLINIVFSVLDKVNILVYKVNKIDGRIRTKLNDTFKELIINQNDEKLREFHTKKVN
jgi:hypothetical protein